MHLLSAALWLRVTKIPVGGGQQSHLQVESVLHTASAYSALSAPCVVVISRSVITILLSRDKLCIVCDLFVFKYIECNLIF